MSSIANARGPETSDPQTTIESVPNLNVGTRKSKLALAQTTLVVDALKASSSSHGFTVKARDTAAGDIDKITPFKDMAVKNLWTHELETLMIEGQLDILVHSLKDVPTQLPNNCEIGGVLKRADPRDALVIKEGRPKLGIADLPAGSVIGTSSIRRTAQVALKYPHLKVMDLRGNVPTRLSKLDAADGPYDAIIVAAAGLKRLGLQDRITQLLDSKSAQMLYAVGQGAIGIENRSDDTSVKKLLAGINHMPTYLATAAERSLLRTLEGGCSAPLGVETEWLEQGKTSTLQMQAIVVSIDGRESAESEAIEEVTTFAQAEQFGVHVAQLLIKEGANKILAEIQAKKRTTAADLVET